ncbi:MAG: hypothetical protein H6514_01290 [Acidimicrobiaceae bacterium]|nr:hypothetical protein [Acidimicrobiaceae bacterium]
MSSTSCSAGTPASSPARAASASASASRVPWASTTIVGAPPSSRVARSIAARTGRAIATASCSRSLAVSPTVDTSALAGSTGTARQVEPRPMAAAIELVPRSMPSA